MSGEIMDLLEHTAPALVEILRKEDVTEIAVNRPDTKIYVNTKGGWRNGESMNADSIIAAAKLFASGIGANFNEEGKTAILTATFDIDGSQKIRVAGLVGKFAPEGPTICIRKHSIRHLALKDIAVAVVREGREIEGEFEKEWEPYDYLAECLRRRRNILIAGGTDSGKTTFANAMLADSNCADGRRWLLIEDTQEIKIPEESNYVRFLAYPDDGVSADDLLKLSLRYRPDSIVVGEVRGGEAYYLVEAWGTGHEGGVSTIHANDARHALLRLQGLVLDGAPKELSEWSACAKIAAGVDVVVHVWRSNTTGRRRIGEIVAVGDTLLANGQLHPREIKIKKKEEPHHD